MSVKFLSTAFEIHNLCNVGSSEKLQFICALSELCNFEVFVLILQIGHIRVICSYIFVAHSTKSHWHTWNTINCYCLNKADRLNLNITDWSNIINLINPSIRTRSQGFDIVNISDIHITKCVAFANWICSICLSQTHN